MFDILLEVVVVFDYFLLFIESIDVESEFAHVYFVDVGQLLRQDLEVPVGELGRLIVREPEGFDLLLGEIIRHDARHLFKSELECRLQSGVTCHHDSVLIDDDRYFESKLLDRCRDLVYSLIIFSGIFLVWDQVSRFLLDDFHVSSLPRPFTTKNIPGSSGVSNPFRPGLKNLCSELCPLFFGGLLGVWFPFSLKTARVYKNSLELDYANTSASRVIFYNLPEFDNVRSNSVCYIDITDNPIKFNGVKSQDLFSSARFKKLFDFGYELSYIDDFVVQTSGKVTIKDMKGLRKLVTAKDFYNREFAEWPYRLKSGAKLSDFIDVSQFKGLYSITITDKKMGVLFEKVDDPHAKQHASYAYFTDMLKQTWEEKSGHKRNEIDNLIPVTADGWRVIIFRR